MSAFRAVAGRHRPPASSSLHSPDTASRPIGQYFAARPDKRNLSDQFLDEQIAKRVEVFCDQDKSTRPANHVVSIVLFQSTWRIRVLAIQCESFVGENDQAIDCNASRNCLVSSQAYITAVIVIAVSGHIDRTPSGVKRCASGAYFLSIIVCPQNRFSHQAYDTFVEAPNLSQGIHAKTCTCCPPRAKAELLRAGFEIEPTAECPPPLSKYIAQRERVGSSRGGGAFTIIKYP